MPRQMWVYILASPSRQLYVGVTNDLRRRWSQHQADTERSYTTRHRIRRLVYCEPVEGQREAIAREKQIKAWRRIPRLKLVESMNPEWRDLAQEWGWVNLSPRASIASEGAEPDP
ncbi:MAG: GIY-YIG nuclease family protein [Gemmatimonadetes bacterium]|nr:GIY-YIG nuclease family protein [Gemmatimonadota bacterium]